MALGRKPAEIVAGSKNPLLGKHESWGRITVSEIAEILNGAPFESSKFNNQKGMPLVRIRDVGKDKTDTYYDGEYDKTFLIDDGDLLIGMDGDFRASVWKGGKALLNQRVCKISLKSKKYNFKFLSYVIQPYLDAIHAETSAVTVKHLSSKSIAEIPLPLPPLDQQKKIVAKIEELFSHIDAGIESLKQSKQLLKKYRQSVLKAAVTGELSKEWREQNKDKLEPASKLLERILQERRKKWEAQQMEQFKAKGKVPKDEGWKERYEDAVNCEQEPAIIDTWVKCRLDTISDAVGGYAFKSSDFTEVGHQIVKMANIKMDILDLENRPSYIENVPEEIIEKYKIVNGDILVTLTGTRNKRDYGYIVLVGKNDKSLLLNQRIARLRPYVSEVSRFLSICLQGKEFRDSFFSYETGNVGQGNVGMRAITEVTINLPPLEEQLEIVRQYDEKITASLRLEHDVDVQLIKAERQKQSILQSAFGGSLLYE